MDDESLLGWGVGLLAIAIVYGLILHFACAPHKEVAQNESKDLNAKGNQASVSEMVSSDDMAQFAVMSEETISIVDQEFKDKGSSDLILG